MSVGGYIFGVSAPDILGSAKKKAMFFKWYIEMLTVK